MKLLAACLLAIALVFQAPSLCASPVSANPVAAMHDCDDARGPKGEKTARPCHSCVFPPVASAVFNHSMSLTAVPSIEAVARFAGRTAEPPTPPPRFGSANHLSTLNGVKS